MRSTVLLAAFLLAHTAGLAELVPASTQRARTADRHASCCCCPANLTACHCGCATTPDDDSQPTPQRGPRLRCGCGVPLALPAGAALHVQHLREALGAPGLLDQNPARGGCPLPFRPNANGPPASRPSLLDGVILLN